MIRWRVGMFVVLIGIAAAAFALWRGASPKTNKSLSPIEHLVANARYVGDADCKQCHEAICTSYERTGMGRAWYLPTKQNVVEDYVQNNHVYDNTRKLHYQMLERDGRFYQREYRLDETGAVIHELEREVHYIVG